MAIAKDKRKKYFDLFADNGVSAVYAGHLHHSAKGEYRGVAMKTTTSVGYQLGEDEASVRRIMLTSGRDRKALQDTMVEIH